MKIEIEIDPKELFEKFSGTGATCGYFGGWWREIKVISHNKIAHIGYVDCSAIETDKTTNWETLKFVAKMEDPDKDGVIQKTLYMPELAKAFFEFQKRYPHMAELEDVIEEDAFLQFAFFGEIIYG